MWKFKKPDQLSLSQSLIKIKKELKKKEKNFIPKRELTSEERALVQQIQDQTKNLSKNNATRTKVFQKKPLENKKEMEFIPSLKMGRSSTS